MPRWLVPLVLALLTGSSAAGALGASTARRGGDEATASPLVPVLSPRRVPGVVSNLVSDTRLRTDLEAVLANPTLGARNRSCLVVRQEARKLFERRVTTPLIPASTMKVLTAQAVLARLGPDHRLDTEVRAAHPVGPGGVVNGALWLVGGGDPVLATADFALTPPDQPQIRTRFETLADALVNAGVRQVTGGVVGDETRYDVRRFVPTWKPTYITSGQVGPASALNVNHGFSSLGSGVAFASQPDVLAAGVLTDLLRARGVVVGAGPGEGKAPPGAGVLARISSPPMREVVAEMLLHSDNLTAELLVKELGHRFANDGSTASGLRIVRETLSSSGLPVSEFSAVDGSGLDRGDVVTCGLLLAAVEANGPTSPLAAGLPVAGRSGTLAQRFSGNPAVGRLRAKTGSLDNVTGLAGYVDPVGVGQHLAFALLANDVPNESAGRALQERIGAILARYPEGPPPATLAP
ncbi:MAG: D-alanyl-D-alanine carboxypeptidase/D-alanyl-D-alanine-endopeptidase [Actinomycetota bacterium]|nr:D-alanyl-D-alanine carboxypeptidase/D-alanyl-D-alanine-endopeptidase [Actinomycetota bacterium]MDQ3574789.1 D-alanyl-D-alanine carboxypeptidase/D-alanyl-D-alanine-endopeptidase [Actinomycetota bacterium]